MNHSLILMMNHDPFHLGAIEEIAHNLSKSSKVMILDTTSISATPTSSYNSKILKVFGFKFPKIELEHFFNDINVKYIKIEDVISGEFLQSNEEKSLIDDAIESALITFFRHHNPRSLGTRVEKAEKKLRAEADVIYNALCSILENDSKISQGVIPNGRFPSQKSAQLAFEKFQIECFHYERGEPPAGIYFQGYAPQARIASQESALNLTSKLSDSEIEEFALYWLKNRSQPGSATNEFAFLWSAANLDSVGDGPNDSKKRAGFFTSSQDEFLHLGKDWQNHSWLSQIDAFDTAITRLEALNYEIFLRIHPNLATKSHDYYKLEVQQFKGLQKQHPGLKIIWHDEPLNTYELLDSLDLCFVWDSTVGLEASALGIPTWAFATTRYGLVADIREALEVETLPRDVFEWEVNRNGAYKFINYLKHRDIQLNVDINKWVSWDLNQEPGLVQLAKVFNSGGNISAIESIRSILDTYRNRNFKSNLIYARQRFKSLIGNT